MDASTAPQSQSDGTTAAAPPETTAFTITNLNELAGAVATASGPVSKPARMYTKEGFKGVDGLDGISNERLAQMAGCCMRQIALNGGDSAAPLLGTEKNRGILAQYGPFIQREAAEERKIDSYLLVATDLGITREAGETASAFIARVQSGLSKQSGKAR